MSERACCGHEYVAIPTNVKTRHSVRQVTQQFTISYVWRESEARLAYAGERREARSEDVQCKHIERRPFLRLKRRFHTGLGNGK
jgi:hypothetical protein